MLRIQHIYNEGGGLKGITIEDIVEEIKIQGITCQKDSYG